MVHNKLKVAWKRTYVSLVLTFISLTFITGDPCENSPCKNGGKCQSEVENLVVNVRKPLREKRVKYEVTHLALKLSSKFKGSS